MHLMVWVSFSVSFSIILLQYQSSELHTANSTIVRTISPVYFRLETVRISLRIRRRNPKRKRRFVLFTPRAQRKSLLLKNIAVHNEKLDPLLTLSNIFYSNFPGSIWACFWKFGSLSLDLETFRLKRSALKSLRISGLQKDQANLFLNTLLNWLLKFCF